MRSSLIRFDLAIGLSMLMMALALAAVSPRALGHPAAPTACASLAMLAGGNLLINPDFGGGYTRPLPCCNNIAVPVGWNIRWYTDTAVVIENTTYTFKQPEVRQSYVQHILVVASRLFLPGVLRGF